MSTAYPLVLQEMAGPKRHIVLAGRCLPRELQLGTAQRMDKSGNQGAAEATIQVFGPDLKPISLAGKWNTRFFATEAIAQLNNQALVAASDLAQLLENICSCGQLVRMSWHREVRYGLIKEFEYTYSRLEDIEWTMTFEPMSKTGSPSAPTTAKQPNLQAFSSQLSGTVDTLEDVRKNPPTAVTNTNPIDAVTRAMDRLSDIKDQAQDTITSYTDRAISASTAVKRALGQVEEAARGTREIVETAQRTSYRELIDIVDQGNATVGQIVATSNWVREIEENGGTFRRNAVQFRDQVKDRVVTQILATHRVVQGQDLFSISEIYYGSADSWWRIAQFNGLVSVEVETGATLAIPRLPDAGEN